jgi:hydroxypyruvate isomerase
MGPTICSRQPSNPSLWQRNSASLGSTCTALAWTARVLPLKPVDVITGDMWLKAEQTLARIAGRGQREGVTFCLENLNTAVDHPGTPFARAADTLALVAAVDSPHLRLMLDIYHAQIGEGNLVELINKCGPYIGEVQVADVPGRCEPGTGEINYPRIAQALRDIGYQGTIGLEAWASGDSEVALERFRAAFTLERWRRCRLDERHRVVPP